MTDLRMMQPQEIEVLYILPAIRRELAIEMKKLGSGQKNIAKLLCVTEAAISQYINSKRASKVKFTKKALLAIKKSARKIKDKNLMLNETQTLLKMLREEGLTCDVHKEFADLPEECLVCFTKEDCVNSSDIK